MKRIYLLILASVVILLAFFLLPAKEKDFSKIEAVINQNASELIKGDVGSYTAEDKKRALELAAKIYSGECPVIIDKRLMPYAIKNLASKSYDETKAKLTISCIENLGIKQAEHYTLMVDLLPFWDKENKLLELFYTKFFKGYKQPDTAVLGLLDNAQLMCVNSAIEFLKKDNYPVNYAQPMTKKEYSLFLEYIKEFRCTGYSG